VEGSGCAQMPRSLGAAGSPRAPGMWVQCRLCQCQQLHLHLGSISRGPSTFQANDKNENDFKKCVHNDHMAKVNLAVDSFSIHFKLLKYSMDEVDQRRQGCQRKKKYFKLNIVLDWNSSHLGEAWVVCLKKMSYSFFKL